MILLFVSGPSNISQAPQIAYKNYTIWGFPCLSNSKYTISRKILKRLANQWISGGEIANMKIDFWQFQLLSVKVRWLINWGGKNTLNLSAMLFLLSVKVRWLIWKYLPNPSLVGQNTNCGRSHKFQVSRHILWSPVGHHYRAIFYTTILLYFWGI